VSLNIQTFGNGTITWSDENRTFMLVLPTNKMTLRQRVELARHCVVFIFTKVAKKAPKAAVNAKGGDA
jgi:hypothetical protein